jgi:aspartyl-tRNA(Asn)/glutamyl-tRNA(Gln) amidotransferase subunit A
MTDDDLVWLSAVDLGRRIRAGEITSLRATSAHLDRISRLNPRLEAFVTITKDRARAEAATADAEIAAGSWRGPLHGVPYCLKDIVQTAGVRTTAGSFILADWVPQTDATVQKRLAGAGAVLLGKVNTHEFAFGATTQNVHGRTRNPHDTERIPGGSSGGSGAAVAAALAPFSRSAATRRTPSSAAGPIGRKSGGGMSRQVGSAGSGPAITAMMAARSSTERAKGPIWSELKDCATTPAALTRPHVGFRPAIPQ